MILTGKSSSPFYASIKRRLVRTGRNPRRVPVGLYRGLILSLDLAHQSQIYVGLSEAETHKLIRAAAAHSQWMIDVGAGQGELSIYFAASSPSAKVFAIEPQACEVEILNQNVALNRQRVDDKIVVLQKYVGRAASDNFVRLDDLPIDRRLRGFVKIDVDGGELEVLASGEKLLSEAPVDLLVETHSLELEVDCIEWLKARGFVPKIVPNGWWRSIIPEHRTIEHNRWLWAASTR